MLPADLPGHWRTLAKELRRFGAEPQARALESCADELTAALRSTAEELLTLRRAAEESGYSVDHVARLLREGKIPNAGEKSRPRVRRCDLPIRSNKAAEKLDNSTENGYISGKLFRDVIHSKYGGNDAQS